MRHILALLIVVLIAGSPGIALACELGCHTPGAERHRAAVGCHRTPDAASADEQVVAADAECHDAPAFTAVLTQSRPPDVRMAQIGSAVHGAPAAATRRDVTQDGRSGRNGRSARRPSLGTILRI